MEKQNNDWLEMLKELTDLNRQFFTKSKNIDRYITAMNQWEEELDRLEVEANKGNAEALKNFLSLDFLFKMAGRANRQDLQVLEILKDEINELTGKMLEVRKEKGGSDVDFDKAFDQYMKSFNPVVEPGVIKPMNKN